MSGSILFLACCFFPAALYVTQPDRFFALLLVGLFAAVVVLFPTSRKARPAQRSEDAQATEGMGS